MLLTKKVRLRTSGNTTITLRKNAERYVKRGRARKISDDLYELIEDNTDHRQASVVASRLQMRYDDGLATLKGVQGLPVTGQAIRLFTGQRPTSPPRQDRVIQISACRADQFV